MLIAKKITLLLLISTAATAAFATATPQRHFKQTINLTVNANNLKENFSARFVSIKSNSGKWVWIDNTQTITKTYDLGPKTLRFDFFSLADPKYPNNSQLFTADSSCQTIFQIPASHPSNNNVCGQDESMACVYGNNVTTGSPVENYTVNVTRTEDNQGNITINLAGCSKTVSN